MKIENHYPWTISSFTCLQLFLYVFSYIVMSPCVGVGERLHTAVEHLLKMLSLSTRQVQLCYIYFTKVLMSVFLSPIASHSFYQFEADD